MYVVIILLIVIFSQILLLRHGIGLGAAVRLRACPDQFDDDALILAVTEFFKLRDPVDFIKCLLHKRPSLLDSTNEYGSALSEAAFLGYYLFMYTLTNLKLWSCMTPASHTLVVNMFEIYLPR